MVQHLKAVSRALCRKRGGRFFCRCWQKISQFVLKFWRYFNLSKLSRYG